MYFQHIALPLRSTLLLMYLYIDQHYYCISFIKIMGNVSKTNFYMTTRFSLTSYMDPLRHSPLDQGNYCQYFVSVGVKVIKY